LLSFCSWALQCLIVGRVNHRTRVLELCCVWAVESGGVVALPLVAALAHDHCVALHRASHHRAGLSRRNPPRGHSIAPRSPLPTAVRRSRQVRVPPLAAPTPP
jgi:hypothetical protein